MAALKTFLLLISTLTLSVLAQSDHNITCFPVFSHTGPLLTASDAQSLITEFFRFTCESNPSNPFVLQPFEGVQVNLGLNFALFQNELDVVANTPGCGEVMDDFEDLVAACFSDTPSAGGLLLETAGGSQGGYIISSTAGSSQF